MYDWQDEPNFTSLANALKAGNPEALVAFNPGSIVYLPIESCVQDFTAGELSTHFPKPAPRQTGQCGVQYHILTYLGQKWGDNNPRFSHEELITMTRSYMKSKWVITWEVPISDDGSIPEPSYGHIMSLRASKDHKGSSDTRGDLHRKPL
jgi:hypothetical protein